MRVAERGDSVRIGVLLAATTLFVCVAGPAYAQIWVVTQPDGSLRFTTQPEPGARVYMRTRHGELALRAASTPAVPYGQEIAAAAAETGVSPALITAVIAAESNFDAQAVSHKGAQGLMQLMPATARELGVDNVWDPGQNVRGGSTHLARLLGRYDDVSLALAAYNAGEASVAKYGGIPPFDETQDYVSKVLRYYERYQGVGQ